VVGRIIHAAHEGRVARLETFTFLLAGNIYKKSPEALAVSVRAEGLFGGLALMTTQYP
jgi:hypothetical protein